MSDDRIILLEAFTGSHLYGTSTATSDTDYTGVFAPSVEDLLGLQNCPGEWSLNVKHSAGPRNGSGDVDRKFYSVRRFIELAGNGQPAQLEQLFLPPAMVLRRHPLWDLVLAARPAFLSRHGIAPFVGFAKSQAHKAVLKGENLNLIRHLIGTFEHLGVTRQSGVLADYFEHHGYDAQSTRDAPGAVVLFGKTLPAYHNDHGFPQVLLAGREYDPAKPIKSFVNGLRALEARYGTRVEAAAAHGYDHKSLLHAVRLLMEAEEFLLTGHITLPRPPDEIEFLMRIRAKEWPEPGTDVLEYLGGWVERLERDVAPQSPLPRTADWSRLNALCLQVHRTILEAHT